MRCGERGSASNNSLWASDQAQARLPGRAAGDDRVALVIRGGVAQADRAGQDGMLVQSEMRMISIACAWR
ncbi:hypothetical protein MF4836_02020 [Pseudomonas sp. MF4836]|nr:hypothetical protein MF4836_02020 [Pseudomonas sp. MF4836]